MGWRDVKRSSSVFIFLFILIATVGLGLFDWPQKSRRGFAHYRIAELAEPSGLVASAKNDGIYWTHNDSGAGPILYATTIDGDLVGRFEIDGAKAIDWEAITTDRRGSLYIADVGNNANWRRDLTIYRILEPSLNIQTENVIHGRIQVQSSIRFHYPEQHKFPDLAEFNFDSEAIFWGEALGERTGALYLLTKHRSDTYTHLYRFDGVAKSKSIPLTLVGRYDLGGKKGLVTGAAMRPDGAYLAVLTYFGVFVFERPVRGDNYLSRFKHKINFDTEVTQQAEAITWAGDSLVFSNEQGDLFRVGNPLEQKRVPLQVEAR
jgi:hypothetical protein